MNAYSATWGGGDPDEFRRNAAGVTPFLIVYTADPDGILRFKEYIATGKSDNSPSIRENMKRLDQYFR